MVQAVAESAKYLFGTRFLCNARPPAMHRTATYQTSCPHLNLYVIYTYNIRDCDLYYIDLRQKHTDYGQNYLNSQYMGWPCSGHTVNNSETFRE